MNTNLPSAAYDGLAAVVPETLCTNNTGQHGPISSSSGDVLICGGCSSQFSDIRLFIEHKQRCGSNINSHVNVHLPLGSANPSIPLLSPPQQIVIPQNGPNTLRSVPHVILQTSSGMPQMYRIVLDPGSIVNSSVSPSPVILEHLTVESNQTEKIGTTEIIPLQTNSPDVHLGSVKSTWDVEREDVRQVEGLSESNISLKQVETPNTISLHTEEDEGVATFLANQLAAHSETVPLNAKNIILDTQADSDVAKLSPIRPGKSMENQTKNGKKPLGHNLNEEFVNIPKMKPKKLKQCQFCIFSTPYKKDLLRHVRTHTGEKPFACEICNFKFARLDKLKVHMRIHNDERPYTCPEPGCSYSAREKAGLRKHSRKHTNERPFKCQLCYYQAKDGSQLTVHLRSHTGDSPFHCQKEGCSSSFKTSSDLKRHEKIHTGEKPYSCNYCDYATAIKPNLKVHIRIKHLKEDRYSCAICPLVAPTKKELKEHMHSHNSENMDQSPSINKDHKVTKLAREKKTKDVLSKKRPRGKMSLGECEKNYMCEDCGSGFVRLDSYRSHMRQHLKNKTLSQNANFNAGASIELKEKSEDFTILPSV